MAATIARAIGRSAENTTETTRLGPASAEAQANTFKTFTTAVVNADGSGSVQVERTKGDGTRVVIGRMEFAAEDSGLLNYVGISGEAGHHVAQYVLDSIVKSERLLLEEVARA